MLYEHYKKHAELNHSIYFDGKNTTLGQVLDDHKEYFNKPPSYLLGIDSSYKVAKGKKLKVVTAIQYLPADKMISSNTFCSNADRNGCAKDCLKDSGRLGMMSSQRAMISRGLFYLYMNASYERQLRYELDKAYMTYGDDLAVRLNGTSDINYKDIIKDYPHIQFYDYTKNRNMMMKNKNKNHHYTFSGSMFSDYSIKELKQAVKDKLNIALAFNTANSKQDKLKIPSKLFGVELVSFDETDARFKDDQGSIGYLTRKGSSIKVRQQDDQEINNFFVTSSNLDRIQALEIN
jgi:hypothetical protein